MIHSLGKRTLTHSWSVSWLNDVESELPAETGLVFAYEKNILHALCSVLCDKLYIMRPPIRVVSPF